MKPAWLILGGALVVSPAMAQDISLKPLIDARLRYENVDQAGLPRDAEATTIRIRSGVQASSGPLSAIVQMQGMLALTGDYYDGLHGAATRPLIADPQNIALYRAQLQYRSKSIALTVGRQSIALDDERFVGAVPFRQNAQTFDATRFEWTGVKGLKADLTYAWRVNTVWGIDGVGARPRSIGGDNVLGNLSYASPVGTITGFAYLVDQDETAVQGFRLSSQTYGARLAGARPLGKGIKLSYQLSYATQSDYHRNPNRYRADYYLIDAGLDLHALKLGAGYEVLGADKGVALTAFQTPIATGFKFQGWADKFLTTPPDGVRDLYGNVGYGWKQAGPFKALTLQAVYHRFAADRHSRLYGDEIDLLASAKLGKTSLSARYADYQADGFATDTRKFWLQLDWSL
ncbi:alginate export family protein [Sphingomonas pruni]|uniref:alginate export family protein n=1 Tax=Sphingomonas pruni TaxID=40683 RepID=UPI00082D6F77|nr:alginate export family protein [Sphingomonas pruni]